MYIHHVASCSIVWYIYQVLGFSTLLRMSIWVSLEVLVSVFDLTSFGDPIYKAEREGSEIPQTSADLPLDMRYITYHHTEIYALVHDSELEVLDSGCLSQTGFWRCVGCLLDASTCLSVFSRG